MIVRQSRREIDQLPGKHPARRPSSRENHRPDKEHRGYPPQPALDSRDQWRQEKGEQCRKRQRDYGEKMRSLDTNRLPVASGDHLVGAVEGKHPERKAAGFGHDPETALVRGIMVKKAYYCFENQSVDEAREIMCEHHEKGADDGDSAKGKSDEKIGLRYATEKEAAGAAVAATVAAW